MGTMTPAQRRALYESARFARETTYNGPLGPEYTPAGTRLRLWAPTAEQAAVNLYRKGHDSPCIGTLPLQRGPQGVELRFGLPGGDGAGVIVAAHRDAARRAGSMIALELRVGVGLAVSAAQNPQHHAVNGARTLHRVPVYAALPS